MEDKIWVVDDIPSRRFPIYTRGNIGEVFPVVVSPLTWPLYGSQAELGWRDAFRDFGAYLGDDFGTNPMGILGCYGGYGYLNASYIRVFAIRTPGLTVDDIDRLFFGESDAPPYAPQAGDKKLQASLRVARTLFKTLGTKSLPELEADKARVDQFIARIPALEPDIGGELPRRVFPFKGGFPPFFGPPHPHVLQGHRRSWAPRPDLRPEAGRRVLAQQAPGRHRRG